jgi:uncharacterized protein (TIGR00255 family)
LIYSMTGYGRVQKQVGGKTITAEIRSVNNRYFDCSVRCPRFFSFLEEPVKADIKASGVTRGKVDVYIGIEYTSGDVAVSLNHGVVESYLSALSELADKYALDNDISVMKLAAFPDVFTVEKIEEERDKLLADVREVLAEAICGYNAMRGIEGEKLAADIRVKAKELAGKLAEIEERMPKIVTEYRERLFEKMRELLGDAQIDEGRLITEAALFADRIATDEETVRLKSHLGQLESILSEGGAVGKKLDFLVQEINREINTIGSKAGDLEVTRIILDMKSELEKIREQIQNIE